MLRRLTLTAERTMIRQGTPTLIPETCSEGLDPNPRNKRTVPSALSACSKPFGRRKTSRSIQARCRSGACDKQLPARVCSGHESWFLPESLNGGCRSSKETSTKTRRAASETPIPAADNIALVTTPPGERALELNGRTPCYCAAADSGANASRSQRRADCARMRSESSGNT